MYSKVEIFNLALSALLIEKEIINPDTDTSLQARTLRKFYNIALAKTIQDLDLDRTSTAVELELHAENPNPLWRYAYKYPATCAFLRRIRNHCRTDNRQNQIPKQTGYYDGNNVIFTNEYQAWAEVILTGVPLTALNAAGGMALAHQLAILSSTLIVGKGATKLRQELQQSYIIFKAEAQEHDRLENSNFDEPEEVSEFVAARKGNYY